MLKTYGLSLGSSFLLNCYSYLCNKGYRLPFYESSFKLNVIHIFPIFKASIEKKIGHQIVTLFTDNGGKFKG